MKNLITFFENTGVNWSVIWSDCSLFVCLVLLIALAAAYWWHKKTIQETKEDYLLKITEKYCYYETLVLSLQIKNADLTSRLQKTERKRNEKGEFLPTSGKGHGKKKPDAN